MAEFRSSARSTGFNAITVPDNARRIQQEGEKQVRDLRRVYDQTIEQQKQFLDDKKSNAEAVERQLNKNERLDSDFRQQYKQALRQRQNAKIEKLKKKQEMERGAYERLGEFSKGAAKLGKELYESHKEDRQAYGLALVMQTGVTAEELADLQDKELDLEAEGAANNRTVERLINRGASPEEINRIRSLNGWALYGAQKALAMQTKEAWYAYTNNPERRNQKFKVGDRELSLEQAEEAGLSSERANIIGQMKATFLKSYSNYDLTFAEKYMFPGMREVDSANQVAYSTRLQKKTEADEQESFINDLNSEIFQATDNLGFQRMSRMADAEGGPLAAPFRRKFMSRILTIAEAGNLTTNDLLKLRNQEIIVNGKKTTFGELYLNGSANETARQFKVIEETVRDQALEESSRVDNERTAVQRQALNDFLEMDGRREPGKPYSLTEIRAVAQDWKERTNNAPMPQEMKAALSNIPVGGDAIINRQAALFDTSIKNINELNTKYPGLSADDREIVLRNNGMDKDGNPLNFKMSDYTSIIKDKLTGVIGGFALDGKANAVKADQAMLVVGPKFEQELQRRIADQRDRSPQDIAQELVDKYVKQIEDDSKTTDGFYSIEGTGSSAQFKNIGSLNTSYESEVSAVVQSFNDNPNIFFDKKALGEPDSPLVKDLLVIERFGEPPSWLINLSQQVNKPWKTLYNAQAVQYGFAPLPLSRAEAAQELISPEVQQYLGRNASPITIQQSTSQQQRQRGVTGLEVYRPVLNLIASKESANDQVHNGYDSMNLGGSNGGHTAHGSTTGLEHFKLPLMEYSLKDIIEMGNRGEIHAAGRYQFVPIAFRDMLERGWMPAGVTLDSPFNEQTQDLLAIAYFRRSIQDFRAAGVDIVSGLGQRWIGLQYLPRHEIDKVVRKMQNDPRYQTPGFQAYEVAPEFEAARQQRYGG